MAEGLGTLFLVAAVVGSGIAAQRLSPADPGLQLLESAIATGAALTALILALHPVSAAFNPIITVIEWRQRTVTAGPALGTIAAQLVGGVLGAVLANLMFGEPAITIAATERSALRVWVGELVATAGLVLVIGGTSRSGRPESVAIAVGAYITAAYWFTSSTSFANPAVTIARMFSNTFAGIAPVSVPPFLLAQAAGGTLGYLITHALHPKTPVPGQLQGDPT
jgi:glycerol uptake facilitator-like aquaporin